MSDSGGGQTEIHALFLRHTQHFNAQSGPLGRSLSCPANSEDLIGGFWSYIKPKSSRGWVGGVEVCGVCSVARRCGRLQFRLGCPPVCLSEPTHIVRVVNGFVHCLLTSGLLLVFSFRLRAYPLVECLSAVSTGSCYS